MIVSRFRLLGCLRKLLTQFGVLCLQLCKLAPDRAQAVFKLYLRLARHDVLRAIPIEVL